MLLACGLGRGSVLEAHISGARQSRTRRAGLRPAPELLRCGSDDKAKRARRSRAYPEEETLGFVLAGEVLRWEDFLFLRFANPIVRRFPRATGGFSK